MSLFHIIQGKIDGKVYFTISIMRRENYLSHKEMQLGRKIIKMYHIILTIPPIPLPHQCNTFLLQVNINSCSAHACYFMYLPCIYTGPSSCLEFQTECLLILQTPVQALHSQSSPLRPTRNDRLFSSLSPIASILPFLYFNVLHITLY